MPIDFCNSGPGTDAAGAYSDSQFPINGISGNWLFPSGPLFGNRLTGIFEPVEALSERANYSNILGCYFFGA